MMDLSVKQKRLLRWVGYPLLTLVTFLFAIFYTFPYDRVKGKIETALNKKYDATIESVSPTLLPGGVVVEGISLRTRPEDDDEEPRTIFIERVEADVGLFALITGDVVVDLEAEIGGGTLSGEVAYGKAGLEADLHGEGLPLTSVPGLQEAFGLPMSGDLNLDVKLDLPKMKWQDADGKIKLACVGCTVGDGEAQLKMKQPKARGRRSRWSRRSMMLGSSGLTVPRLELGSTSGELVIDKGTGTIEKLKAESKDGELSLEGEVRFTTPVKRSSFELCLRFNLSESLEKREPKFGSIDDVQAAKFKQPDGSVAIPLRFDGRRLRVDKHRRCKGAAPPSRGQRTRPTITARPPEEEAEPEPAAEEEAEEVAAEEEEPAEEEPPPEGEEPSEEERARRAGEEGGEEPEVEGPGRSGPELSDGGQGRGEEPLEGERLEGEPLEGERLEGERLEDEPLEGERLEDEEPYVE